MLSPVWRSCPGGNGLSPALLTTPSRSGDCRTEPASIEDSPRPCWTSRGRRGQTRSITTSCAAPSRSPKAAPCAWPRRSTCDFNHSPSITHEHRKAHSCTFRCAEVWFLLPKSRSPVRDIKEEDITTLHRAPESSPLLTLPSSLLSHSLAAIGLSGTRNKHEC